MSRQSRRLLLGINIMKINYELLEDRIKTLRMHAGDSQQDLADAIGVTRATVSAIENCSKTEAPSAEMIITIAQHYHVSVDYLIGDSNLSYDQNKSIRQLNLSQAAVEILMNGYVDNRMVSLLLERREFIDLLNKISAYLSELTFDTYNAYQSILDAADKDIDSYKESAGIPKQKYDKDHQLLKAQIKDFDPAMLNSFTTEFGKIINDIKDEYGIDEKNRADIALQNAKITEVSSTVLNRLKGKPFTAEMVADLLSAKMKEERVFGKNPEVYKMLKQMYMIVFKEKQMDKLKGK